MSIIRTQKTIRPPIWYSHSELPTNLPGTYGRPLMAGDFVRTRTDHPNPYSGTIIYIHKGVARLGNRKIPTKELTFCRLEWNGESWDDLSIL